MIISLYYFSLLFLNMTHLPAKLSSLVHTCGLILMLALAQMPFICHPWQGPGILFQCKYKCQLYKKYILHSMNIRFLFLARNDDMVALHDYSFLFRHKNTRT